MKKLVITLAALFIAFVSFADTIDIQQAREIARKWLDSEVTEVSFGSDAFYLFNGDSGGWIIISAEDKSFSDKVNTRLLFFNLSLSTSGIGAIPF